MPKKTEIQQPSDQDVAEYYARLQLSLGEHETKFDNSVLLVAGGAFTISAAFVSGFEGPLKSSVHLATAWVSWALCLALAVGGHLIGAHATKRVIKLLDEKQYDIKVLTAGWAAKTIGPINYLTFVLLIVGFVGFGSFTFENLKFGDSNEAKAQVSIKKESGEEIQWVTAVGGEQRSAPEPKMATPEKKEVIARDKQAKTTSTHAAANNAKADAATEKSAADTRQADSSHNTDASAGLGKAKEVSASPSK